MATMDLQMLHILGGTRNAAMASVAQMMSHMFVNCHFDASKRESVMQPFKLQ